VDFVFKRVHPEDLSLVHRVIENAKAGESLDFEHRLLLPDGSVKHVHVIARLLTSASEVEFVGTVMDVTARKKAFEEIKANFTERTLCCVKNSVRPRCLKR
jgi:PAS domain S-box-containing protein